MAPRVAEKARIDLLKELRPAVLEEITRSQEEGQLHLNRERSLDDQRIRLGATPFESMVFDELKRLPADTPDAVRIAISVALEESTIAMLRATEGHVYVKSPQDCSELMRRMKVALKAADCSSYAASLSRGIYPVVKLPKATLGLDDDIGKQR